MWPCRFSSRFVLQAFDELERTGYNWASKDKVIILEEDLEIGEIGTVNPIKLV